MKSFRIFLNAIGAICLLAWIGGAFGLWDFFVCWKSAGLCPPL